MDYETAKQWLDHATDRRPSDLGKAIDVLYRKYGSYKEIASQVALSTGRLSDLHRVFLLPKGIRWQVDEGRIRIGHAPQISRLQENDQWRLAFIIVEEKKMTVQDSKAIVDAVLKKGQRLQQVLETRIGFRFDQVKPLMVGISFEDQFRIIRAAWNKELDWADFSLKAIEEATRVDLDHIAGELESLAHQLRPKCGDPALKPDSGSIVPSAEEST